MVVRNITLPFSFICFTDDSRELNKKINIRPLPNLKLSGWWYKPYFFKKNLLEKGETNFFIDLDMVVVSNIDKLFEFQKNDFLGLRDPYRAINPKIKKLGSAVMRWKNGSFNNIWDNLEKDLNLIKKYKGDQDYIWDVCENEIKFYPDNWILSYKWEVRSRNELTKTIPRKFINVRSPDLNKETCILAFHGSPMLHTVRDEIILNNWI
jgi:RNAse (barnase) inhibitor barstar